MIFDVVIVSPHGYFGQANVLGMPDTGGQVPNNGMPIDIARPSFNVLFSHPFDTSSFPFFAVLRLFIYWTKFVHWRMKWFLG